MKKLLIFDKLHRHYGPKKSVPKNRTTARVSFQEFFPETILSFSVFKKFPRKLPIPRTFKFVLSSFKLSLTIQFC